MAHYSDLYNQDKAFKELEKALAQLEQARTALEEVKVGDWSLPYLIEEVRDAELEVEKARKEYNEWLPSWRKS